MKIKGDFVTNSSSTNFYFVFKGDHIDLYQRMLEHKNRFELQYESFDDDHMIYEIGAWDVIREIDKVIKTTDSDLWLLKEVEDIDLSVEHFLELKRHVSDLTSPDQPSDFYKKICEEVDHIISLFKEAKEKGLKSCLMISFGENHGDVHGNVVGRTMDRSGYGMIINCVNFVVFTLREW